MKTNDLSPMIDMPSKTNTKKLLGHEVIKGYLKLLDTSPGVYRMLDEAGGVLYVGKARQLRNRVASYARPTGHSARIAQMISKTHSMMFLTTQTETEALLLEQNLIKQLKPKYNVLLRDDKSFPYIAITSKHDYPMISLHRGKRDKENEYYGPFASAGYVNQTLHQLQKIFLLRNCSDSMFSRRTRPCLQYQIGRCSAPCVHKITVEAYKKLVDNARAYLQGKTTAIQKEMATAMYNASQSMEFEKAASYRDRIRALTNVQSRQGINPRTVGEADVFALYQEGRQSCIQVFFIRANQNWGNHAYYPNTGNGADSDEILENFIAQFYVNKIPPRLILLSHPAANVDLLSQALMAKRGGKVDLIVPQKGERMTLIFNAQRNAREALGRKISESVTQVKLLNGLADAFDLPKPIKRVEVYDNSHIQGVFSVGAMIVSGVDGFMKSAYRKFNIKSQEMTPGDDLGMMKEVLERRFKALLKEDFNRHSENWPDLLLIDGGATQVKAVKEILNRLEIDTIPFIGVAKGVDRNHGKEVFHRPNGSSFALQRNDPVLYFIQRLRDEAHRFAISTHRARRSKAISLSRLDNIPGVGAARKRAILAHFGSAKAASDASLKDLKAVSGLSDRIALTIYNFFHDKE